jgi:DNA (cytosine-5)-methyltransferase 1
MAYELRKQRPIAVDLFAGAGGMTLGFEQAGFDVLASVEIDPIHCAIHKFNFPFWTVLCQSVVDTTGEEIRKRSQIGDREIDVVICGSPYNNNNFVLHNIDKQQQIAYSSW